MRSTPQDHSIRIPALLLLLFAVAAFFWSREQAMLRLSPADFACWHQGLNDQAGLYPDQPELLLLADSPVAVLEAEATRNRRLVIEGANWISFFETVHKVIGRDCNDLEGDLCSRVSPLEADYVNGLFYAADEAPLNELNMADKSGAFYLYLRDAPQIKPLQLLPIQAGVTEGKVIGCRWYYSNWQLPSRFRYPLRRYSPWMFGLGLLVLFWGPLLRTATSLKDRTDIIDPKLVNYRKRSARMSLGITLAILAGLLFGILPDPEGDYVPPLIFAGGFLLLMALITTVILWRSALRQDRLFLGQELLARWEFPPQQWRRHVEMLFQERSKASHSLLLLVGIIMLVIGGGFVFAMQDEASLFVAGILVGVFALVTLVAVLAPIHQRRFLLSRPGLVLIAPGGVYFSGEFHDFHVIGTRLEVAEVREDENQGYYLDIVYSFQTRAGRQTAELAIPIPKGREQEAKRVAAELTGTV